MPESGLLDRHVAFVEALRACGMPVSLSEDLDAAQVLIRLPLGQREILRAGYAAALVKRQTHRANFDALFDLYFPALIGAGVERPGESGEGGEPGESGASRDGPEQLADFRERLSQALAAADPAEPAGLPAELEALAREGVGRFGRMNGRAPGLSTFSAYSALHRIDAQRLLDRLIAGMVEGDPDDEPAVRRRMTRRLDGFTRAAEADARRRVAEVKGADRMAEHATRPAIENLDFTQARRADLDEMRRQIHPLARRLASRISREHHARRRGALDVRRTVRTSLATGGVPLDLRQRPKRPGRPELVVLCDVSGSVANFAQFTLMLVFVLREQFTRVRAFTFVDDIHEVTDRFTPGADPVDTMADLAASVAHASLWGRTNYGRAFERFLEEHPDALTPRSSLLVLGDARSNYSDLGLGAVGQAARSARRAFWLNPEHPRHWDTGDSAASAYAELIPMRECRNLTQLSEFVHDIVR